VRRIEKAAHTGFCFGVKRAVRMVEDAARERGEVTTLGSVVHNEQVIERLAELGVTTARTLDDVSGGIVITSSHGITPETEADLAARQCEVISTTCPNVTKAQNAARTLAEAGFFVLVYGSADHPEVKGILGWAGGRGLATTDDNAVAALDPMPRKIGVLAQTTQVPGNFADFAKTVIDHGLHKNSEIRIIDTICHDLRARQVDALELARRADLMLLVGGRHSANTNRLAELCAKETETHLIETAEEIDPAWVKGKERIGVASGASTAEETVEEVMRALETLP
jgi:4-hydroxy-3-methylbut-2-enyl diphosphate reductase